MKNLLWRNIWKRNKHVCDIRPIERIYVAPPTTELIKEHASNLKCERGSDHEIWPVRTDIIDGSYNYFWQCLSCYNDNEAIRNTYERIIKEALAFRATTDEESGFYLYQEEELTDMMEGKLEEAEKYFQV